MVNFLYKKQGLETEFPALVLFYLLFRMEFIYPKRVKRGPRFSRPTCVCLQVNQQEIAAAGGRRGFAKRYKNQKNCINFEFYVMGRMAAY